MTQQGASCPQLQLSLSSSGPLTANFPYPNLFCQITVDCSSPSVSSQIFNVTSYSQGCSSASIANTIYYQAVSIPNQVYQEGVTAPVLNHNLASLAIIQLSACQTQVSIFTQCYLLETTTGLGYQVLPISPATSFDSINIQFPTTTVFFATDYNYYCTTNCLNCVSFFSNTFQITVNPTCSPTITSQPLASYLNNVLSIATPVVVIATANASTTNPTYCVLSYALQYLNGTSYIGTDLSMNTSTGVASIISNLLFSENLQIQITSTYSTISMNSVTSSKFFINQVCGQYCTPSISGILTSYSLIVSSNSQIVTQSYGTTTNSQNCVMYYSLQNPVGNTTYTGSDITISPTTGIIQTQNLNVFTLASIQITITSYYATLPCSGTTTSQAFSVTTSCNGYCTPTISGITQTIYSVSFMNPQQVILQSYATTSNPTYCVMSYSAIYAFNSSAYQGNLFTIVPTTGQIIVNSSSTFLSDQIIIKVTSSCTFASCAGTVSSIPFQINATRSINCQNVQIIPPSNFQFKKVLSTNGPNFVYSNFTTSSPYCGIQSHTIVYNSTNQNVPTGLLQTLQGTSSFTINVNQQYIDIPNLYDFNIKVETVGGQILYKQAQIFVDQCGYDQILLNPQMPVFSFNKIAGYSYKIDLSSYFISLYPTYCLLSFQILKVTLNNIQIPQQNYSSLFGISGIHFNVYPQTQEIFTNYLIEIQASNGKIKSENSQLLIFNASIYLIQETSNNSNNQTLNIQSKENKNQATNQTQKNQNNKNLQLNFKYNPFQKPKQYTYKHDNITGQLIEPVMINQYSMNENGILTLVFNQNLTVPDFAQTALNLSTNVSINQSTFLPQKISTKQSLSNLLSLKNIIQFYIIPNSNIDKNLMKFEAKLIHWDNQGMQIQLNFSYPQIISQGKVFDQLAFQILNGSNFTSNQSKSNFLNINYNGFFKVDIPPQSFVLQSNTKQIVSTIQGGTSSIVIIQIFIQFLMKKSITPNQKLLLNLQMQTSLSYFQIILPFQAQYYLNVVKSVIDFKFQQIFESLGIKFNLKQFLKAQENSSVLPANLQRSGVDSTSMLYQMSTFLILIGAFILFLMLITIFLTCQCSREHVSNYLKSTYQKMKFNGIIRILTVGYLKQAFSLTSIFICQRNTNWIAFKNQKEREKIQNIFQWSFSLLALIMIPLVFFIIIKKNKQNLKSKDFSKSFGNLIEGMKIRKTMLFYIYPLLLVNRFIFAMIPFSIWNYPSIQIIALILESLLYLSYLAGAKINIYWLEYFQDIFNENALLLMYTLLLYFGDDGLIFGSDTSISIDTKIQANQIAGFTFVSIGILVILVNFGLISIKLPKYITLMYQKNQNEKIAEAKKQKSQKSKLDNTTTSSLDQQTKDITKEDNEKQLDKQEYYIKAKTKRSKPIINNKKVISNVQNQFDQMINQLQIRASIREEAKVEQIQLTKKIKINKIVSDDSKKFNAPLKKIDEVNLKNESIWQQLDPIQKQFLKICIEHRNLFGIVRSSKVNLRQDDNINMMFNIEECAFSGSDNILQLNRKTKKIQKIVDDQYMDKNVQEFNQFRIQKRDFDNSISSLKDQLIKYIIQSNKK